jgi:NAD(P)-dependent dehydrogenase (short-subunit alcohol dehydrogenase family)
MLSSLLDRALDLTVAPGFSRVGYELRRRTWSGHGRIDADLTGRTVLVTGATSGLGRAAALGFAELGARVLLLGRDPQRLARTREEIAGATGNDDVDVVLCDLSSLEEVRRAAAEVRASDPELHVLVNNAGVLAQERTLSPDGHELTFATNVLGMFLLTELLLGPLEAGAPSRIINVSSGGMYAQRLDLDDLQTEHRPYDGTAVYARTKRAEVLLTQEWARRLAGTGIVVHAMHPGWADTPGVQTSLPRFRAVTRPILRDARQGADTIVWLGAAEEPAASTGRFWHDRRARGTHRLPTTREQPGVAARLYAQCAELSGLRELVPTA